MIEVTSSTSGSTGTGLKKCMPSTRPGVLGLGAELHDRHGRGVRGQELRVGQQIVEPPEDAALELLVLDHGLDRRVDAVEVLEDRGHDEVVERRGPAVLVELAGLHRAPQRALDRGARTLRALVVGLDDRHVHTGPGTHLRDARAHQAHHRSHPLAWRENLADRALDVPARHCARMRAPGREGAPRRLRTATRRRRRAPSQRGRRRANSRRHGRSPDRERGVGRPNGRLTDQRASGSVRSGGGRKCR